MHAPDDRALGLARCCLLLALRAAATVASYAAGTPGGVFAPILGLATVAGLAYSEAVSLLLPGLALEPTAVAAAAMAALFTGSIRAPLVGVVLVAELTDAYPALLAITLSSAMASLTAAALRGPPALRDAARAKPAAAAVNFSRLDGGPASTGRAANASNHRQRRPRLPPAQGGEAEIEVAQGAGDGDRADIHAPAEPGASTASMRSRAA